MIIIGEKINGSIPIVAEAIAKRDSEFIKARAKLQAESGATYIDCCASVPEAEEVETLKWMIDCIQEVTDLPISIDSPSPDVLAQAYKFCKKPGIFNSVSGEGHKIDTIFPIMAEPGNEGWQVIALLSDNTGIPKCAADRLKVFDKIMAKTKEYGIAPSRLNIDPMVVTLIRWLRCFVLLRMVLQRILRRSQVYVSSIRPFILRQQSVIFPLICRFVS